MANVSKITAGGTTYNIVDNTSGYSKFSGSYNDLTNKPTIPTTTSSVTSGSSAALTSGGAYTALSGKQATLVGSGTGQNIKTINGNSLLGSGNIAVSAVEVSDFLTDSEVEEIIGSDMYYDGTVA